MTPPRTQTPPLRVLNGGAQPTSGVETVEVISPELALVDPELATRARASLRTYDGDELVAGMQPTSHADEIAPEPSGDEETVLSPELALVDPELAARARAQLADGEPASPAAPVRQPEQPPQSLRPSRVAPRRRSRGASRTHASRMEQGERHRGGDRARGRARGGGCHLGSYDDGQPRALEESEQPRFSRLRERSPATAIGERGETDDSESIEARRWPVREIRQACDAVDA
jgi:hypothetical protein